MIEQTKCRSCNKTYELTWDEELDWADEYDDECTDDNEYDDPVYCPFCGTHCDYDE